MGGGEVVCEKCIERMAELSELRWRLDNGLRVEIDEVLSILEEWVSHVAKHSSGHFM